MDHDEDAGADPQVVAAREGRVTERIEIYVPAVPVAQPRPRATKTPSGHARIHEQTRTGPKGNRRPHPILAFKATVKHAAREAYQGPPLDGPLRVDVTFVFPRVNAQIWKTKPMPRLLHTKKPDRDNLDKSIMDSLNGLLWVDDAQVCDGRIQKFIAAGDEQPHCVIVVTPMEEIA